MSTPTRQRNPRPPRNPVHSQLGRPIPEQDARALEAWCQQRWFASLRPTERRAALAISLGLHGLRGGEVTAARVFHLRHDGLLYVPTLKKGNPREVQLDLRLATALLDHHPRPASDGDPLLRSRNGHALNDSTLFEYMRLVTPTLGDEFAFHACRHTAAMRLYHATHDTFAVMHMLGHRSLAQTHNYIKRHTPTDNRGFPRWAPNPDQRRLRLLAPPPRDTNRPWWEELWDSPATRLTRWTRPDKAGPTYKPGDGDGEDATDPLPDPPPAA